jgi:hypothetical protein
VGSTAARLDGGRRTGDEVVEPTRADMTDVADQASGTARRPWASLEQALLARGARSVVVSERADAVGVRFAIDEGQVLLEVPTGANGGEVSWYEVQDVLVAKLELVRSGRSMFAAEFPDGAGHRRRRTSRALAVAAVALSLCAGLLALGAGHLPASVVRVVTAPFGSTQADEEIRPEPARAEQATRDAR